LRDREGGSVAGPVYGVSGRVPAALRQGVLVRAAIRFLKVYKIVVSPLLPRACRFEPTCSEYAKEAIERYGVGKGLLLGLKRLCRCQPFSAGGFDPVR
jgi:putative membrane protein insertion efficiency factor